MEFKNLNKSVCKELFGGELDVTEKTLDPFESDKSQVRLGEDGELRQDQEEHAPPYQGWNPGGKEGARGAAV